MARYRPRTGLSPGFYIRRQAVRRGLFGEDRYWRLAYSLMNSRRTALRLFGRQRIWRPIYTTVYAVRLLRKILGFGPQLVSVEKLRPGQYVGIEAIDPRTLTAAERKRYRR